MVYKALQFLARVVQGLDNAIRWINRYPAGKCYKKTHSIRSIVIHPVDSVVHFVHRVLHDQATEILNSSEYYEKIKRAGDFFEKKSLYLEPRICVQLT